MIYVLFMFRPNSPDEMPLFCHLYVPHRSAPQLSRIAGRLLVLFVQRLLAQNLSLFPDVPGTFFLGQDFVAIEPIALSVVEGNALGDEHFSL